jgi:hypothetical protein
MKTKTHPVCYRQGDVLVERAALLPSKLTKIARENGRVILAHGEVTGHAHALDDPGTELFQAEDGDQYLRVKGDPMKARLLIVRRWRSQVLVKHSKLGLIQFHESDVIVRDNHVLVDGDFALLRHDEHTAHALPAGDYRNLRQSEYDPEEIRRVAD